MDTGTDDGADPALERVRRELALLGRDDASAPEVPAEVTARIGAALRAAPAHGIHRPRLGRAQRLGLVIGLAAVLVGTAIGASMLLREPASPFPAGPTAHSITVSRPAFTFPLSASEVLALLAAMPDFGQLSDGQRRASCLDAVGHPGSTVLGARPVTGDTVVLVLPGATAGTVVALQVAPDCGVGNGAVLADTVVRRP